MYLHVTQERQEAYVDALFAEGQRPEGMTEEEEREAAIAAVQRFFGP